ncbi:CBS domain-containing protein [Streptomyces beihaiensis]|uniref:CBS domain-containing protein n=1 Tax=Streptomyces beihaiensis TaxID=2984495 RepID=A0ABT3U0A5_9ACTN|nr:CBS domain-containing protein [Streptomyces beihaiensis]MCX3061720.1 CBS domain-containing protein [Streptomyces beihaiensis]
MENSPYRESRPYQVADVMTRPAVAVGREDLFKDVVERLMQGKVSALPVLEGDGRVIGVVSEADLLPKEEFRDSDPDRLTQLRRAHDLAKAGAATAGELMSTPAVTVHADATLSEAARIMARRHVKRLPVVGPTGRLEGMVSRGDLLKVFLRPDNDLADEIRRDIVDPLFPAPIEPVHVVVAKGVATLTGRVTDPERIELAARLARGVEGVVDVDCRLTAEV